MAALMAPLLPHDVEYIDANQLIDVLNRSELASEIESRMRVGMWHTLSKEMEELSQATPFLQLAICGTKGFVSSGPVAKLAMDYQRFVNDTFLITEEFVDITLEALREHLRAIKKVDDKDCVIASFTACGQLAKQIADKSGRIASAATTLADKTNEGLLATMRDEGSTAAHRRSILAGIEVRKAAKEHAAKKLEHLKKHIQNASEDEEAIRGKLLRAHCFDDTVNVIRVVSVVGWLFPSCCTADAVEKQHEAAQRTLKDLRDEALSEKTALYASVSRLQKLNKEKKALSASMTALDIAFKHLGKVQSIFENVRLFWLSIERYCSDLSKKDLAVFEGASLKKTLHASGIDWLVLARLNLEMHIASLISKTDIDTLMDRFPSEDEARVKIDDLCSTLLIKA